MKAKRENRTTEVVQKVTKEVVVVEMTPDEAQMMHTILANIGGTGKYRNLTNDLMYELEKAKITFSGESPFYSTPSFR